MLELIQIILIAIAFGTIVGFIFIPHQTIKYSFRITVLTVISLVVISIFAAT